MSKKKNGQRDDEGQPVDFDALNPDGASGEAHAPPVSLPEGYDEVSGELVGFWNGSGNLHFIPQYARAFDNGVEPVKPSILIVGTSVGENHLLTAPPDSEAVTSKSGELIGVWYKPGMSAIAKLANTRVFIYPTGERDTGKPNAMKTFSVNKPKDAHGTELFITDDFRKKSKQTSLPLRLKGAANRAARRPAEDQDEDFGDQF